MRKIKEYEYTGYGALAFFSTCLIVLLAVPNKPRAASEPGKPTTKDAVVLFFMIMSFILMMFTLFKVSKEKDCQVEWSNRVKNGFYGLTGMATLGFFISFFVVIFAHVTKEEDKNEIGNGYDEVGGYAATNKNNVSYNPNETPKTKNPKTKDYIVAVLLMLSSFCGVGAVKLYTDACKQVIRPFMNVPY